MNMMLPSLFSMRSLASAIIFFVLPVPFWPTINLTMRITYLPAVRITNRLFYYTDNRATIAV
jgi:hypothetical protein